MILRNLPVGDDDPHASRFVIHTKAIYIRYLSLIRLSKLVVVLSETQEELRAKDNGISKVAERNS